MSSFALNKKETFAIRDSWATLSATHNDGDRGFVCTVFANLLSSNPRVKSLLEDNGQLEKQQVLITEIIDVLMTYMEDINDLEEHLNTFIQQNSSIVKFGVLYLEPLGAIFIKTMKQFLSPHELYPRLESLWVEAYIHLANFILQNDSSDSESVFSNTVNSASSLDEEIQPLNCKQVPTIFDGYTQYPVKLEENKKYRGFRRNTSGFGTDQSFSPVSAKPDNSLRQASFNISQFEPQLSPRSPRRSFSISSKSSETKDEKRVFDPRRRAIHRKTSSDSSLKLDTTPSCEASGTHYDLYADTEDIIFNSESRSSLFDCTSFGIAGLAPIAECADVEDCIKLPSKATNLPYGDYGKAQSVSSVSRSSSLSLYDSKQISPISSIRSTSVKTFQKESCVPSSSMSKGHSYPLLQKRYSSSVPSFTSHNSSGTASIGFMRSSFVLKKTLNAAEQPQNTKFEADCEYSQRRSKSPFSQSSNFLPDYSTYNGGTVPTSTKCIGQVDKNRKFTSCVQAAPSPENPEKSRKSSFRSMLRKIFGSESKSIKLVSKSGDANPQVKSQMVSVTSSKKAPDSSSKLQTRLNAKDIKHATIPTGYAASVYSRPRVPGDLSSVLSADHRSVLSFDGTMDSKRTTNKYLVKKVPYKTVSLKDLIA